MSKALMGYVGQPPAYMILRELNALKARVAELERALALAEVSQPRATIGTMSRVVRHSRSRLADGVAVLHFRVPSRRPPEGRVQESTAVSGRRPAPGPSGCLRPGVSWARADRRASKGPGPVACS